MAMSESGDERETLLKRDVLLVATAGLSLLNGMHFSPLFDPIFFLVRPFAPGFFSSMPMLLFYFTSLLISLTTLLLAGVPAALYERIRGLKDSTPVSLGIWFATTLILTLPGLMGAMSRG
jgi:hypothetical protein